MGMIDCMAGCMGFMSFKCWPRSLQVPTSVRLEANDKFILSHIKGKCQVYSLTWTRDEDPKQRHPTIARVLLAQTNATNEIIRNNEVLRFSYSKQKKERERDTNEREHVAGYLTSAFWSTKKDLFTKTIKTIKFAKENIFKFKMM